MDGVNGDYLDFGANAQYAHLKNAGQLNFWWNERVSSNTGYICSFGQDDNNFIEMFFENGELGLVFFVGGQQLWLSSFFSGNSIGVANQFLGKHHYKLTWDNASLQLFMDGNATPVLTVAGDFRQTNFVNPKLFFGESTVSTFQDQAPGNGSVTQVILCSSKGTGAEENAYFYQGTLPTPVETFWSFFNGSGTVSVGTGIGNAGILQGSGTVWVTNPPSFPRNPIRPVAAKAIGTAQVKNFANTLGYFPHQSCDIDNYAVLAGHPTTAQQTITNTATLVGATWQIVEAGVILIEGADWTSPPIDTPENRILAAASLSDALNTAAGMTVATVVGPVINFSVSGENDGLHIACDQAGITPQNTIFSGGITPQKITAGNEDFKFDDIEIYQSFNSNNSAADAFVNYVNNNSSFHTATSLGNVVTVWDIVRGVSHNGVLFSVTPSDSTALTPHGANLAGGSGNDPLLVGSSSPLSPVLMDAVHPWGNNNQAAASIAAYYVANTVYTGTFAVGDTVYFVYNTAGTVGNGVGITHAGSQSDLATANFAGGYNATSPLRNPVH